MNSETPTILTSSYASNAVNPGNMMLGSVTFGGSPVVRTFENWGNSADLSKILQQAQLKTTDIEIMPTTSTRRYVQVFIADPNENVPLEESVLYKGDQKLTDLTDTELFFEVPIAETLKSHNVKRVGWLDRDATKKAGKDVFLDPVKIRDLKMVVVTIAQF